MRFNRVNIIFDDTIPVSKTKYEEMKDQIEIDKSVIQSLKEIISQQARDLEEYKTFFKNFKNLVDKQ